VDEAETKLLAHEHCSMCENPYPEDTLEQTTVVVNGNTLAWIGLCPECLGKPIRDLLKFAAENA
jgi:hypothetical protein